MIHKMFSVYDEKAKAYLPPFFLHTVGMAHRAFADAVNDPSHMFAKHPEDFYLFRVGEFNDESGVVESVVPMELIVSGIQSVVSVRKGGSVDENA